MAVRQHPRGYSSSGRTLDPPHDDIVVIEYTTTMRVGEHMPNEGLAVPLIKSTKKALKQYARFKGLPVNGTKQDLVDRINRE